MTKQQQRVLRAARSVVAAWAREGLTRRRFPYGDNHVNEAFADARVSEKILTEAVGDLRGAEP